MEERIRKVLNEINDEICSYQGEQLLEDKIIDSFDIMEIITGLEAEFGIEIDAANVIAENFVNVQSIINMMKRCLDAEQAV